MLSYDQTDITEGVGVQELSLTRSCVLRDMTAEQWSNHALNLLTISRHHAALVPFFGVVTQLGVRNTHLWTGLLNRLLSSTSTLVSETIERLSFVIHCVFQLDTMWTSEESIIAQLLPITSDICFAFSVFQTLVVAQCSLGDLHRTSGVADSLTVKDDISDLLECCELLIRSFVDIASDNAWSFTVAMLTHTWSLLTNSAVKNTSSDSDSSGAGVYMRQYSLLEAVNYATRAAIPTVHRDASSVLRHRLALETPIYSDVIIKDTPVCYLSLVKRCVNDDNSEEQMTLTTNLAILVSTHRDDGPTNPAFYTLLLSDEQREVQTEARRYYIFMTVLHYCVEYYQIVMALIYFVLCCAVQSDLDGKWRWGRKTCIFIFRYCRINAHRPGRYSYQ
jgi:hypothetical protein